MKRLTANKTKMILLCREYGLDPKNALFTKASRTWWLMSKAAVGKLP